MDLSPIAERLYVAARPQASDAVELAALGARLLLNMTPQRAPASLRADPLTTLWLPWLDTRWLPLPSWLLRRGALAARQALESGGAVIAYCREGRHRSVAMACAILITQGKSSAEAMELVRRARPVADPHAPHVEAAIRRFEASWSAGRRPAA